MTFYVSARHAMAGTTTFSPRYFTALRITLQSSCLAPVRDVLHPRLVALHCRAETTQHCFTSLRLRKQPSSSLHRRATDSRRQSERAASGARAQSVNSTSDWYSAAAGPARGRRARRGSVSAASPSTVNDPYAGSPTKTLLRLLLPRSDQVRLTFRAAARRPRAPCAARSP